MAGRTGLSRRDVALALCALPLATCQPARPDKDVAFLPDKKAQAVPPGDPKKLVELVKLDPAIRLDIRYATANNFTGRVLYDQPRAFMASAAAQALIRAHARAKRDGYGFTIYDAYRPWRITRALWDATPPGPERNYVANPKRGSKHNRGCAVDMTMHDLATGKQAEMPSGYDEFSERAHRDYAGGSEAARANRARLQAYMEAEGFRGISNEWWHFDFNGWEEFPVMDIAFDDIRS